MPLGVEYMWDHLSTLFLLLAVPFLFWGVARRQEKIRHEHAVRLERLEAKLNELALLLGKNR